jgi:hypothetical protein
MHVAKTVTKSKAWSDKTLKQAFTQALKMQSKAVV